MTPEDTRLLTAIYAVVGGKEFTAGDLIRRVAGLAARDYPELVAAIGRAKNANRLGWWLKKLHGARLGEHTLEADYSKHLNRWGYQFVPDIPCPPMPEPKRLPNVREAVREIKREEKRKVKEQREKDHANVRSDRETAIAYAHAMGWGRAEWVDSDGQIRRELLRNRDGEPIVDKPAAEPAHVPEPPKPQRHNPDVRPPWMVEGRNPTRKEWDAWQKRRGATHHQTEGPAFSDGGEDWFIRACAARNARVYG